jgi:hypothetical protein
MSLIGSNYAFEDKLDMEALNEISSDCSREISEYKNGFAVLKGVYTPFGGLLNQISSNWGKEDLSQNVSHAVSNFDMSVFNELQ